MTAWRWFGHGIDDLRAHPWRAVLSGLSLCIGVLAVVAIFTASAITAEVFIAVEEQRNGRLVTANGAVTVGPGFDASAARAVLDAAGPLTGSGGAAALVARPTSITGLAPAGQPAPVSQQPVLLVAGDLPGVRRLPQLAGRWFDSRADLPVELVVSPAAAARWGGVGTQVALMATMDQPAVSALIVGIVATGDNESSVFASLTALLHARPSVLAGAQLELTVHHPRWTLDQLTSTARIMATAGHGRLVQDQLQRADTVAQLLSQLDSQRTAFLAVALLALAISALGLLNIGLASVGERARELVTRRAIGATRAEITGQLLVSAAIVGVVSAAGAIAIAMVGIQVWLPSRLDPATAISPPGLPWQGIVWGVAASVITTLAGSAIPAMVAGRLDVANALRD